MNERIRELRSIAQKYVLDIPAALETAEFDEIFEEKFAELIVGECCRALNPMLRDMISRGQAADLIKKHFGVES